MKTSSRSRPRTGSGGPSTLDISAFTPVNTRTVVSDHSKRELYHVRDADLLRVSGAFNKLGVNLGVFNGDDLGCQNSCFQFGKFPPYRCDVLLKADASFFCHDDLKMHNPRAVVIALKPEAQNLPEFVDVIALTVLAEELRGPCRN